MSAPIKLENREKHKWSKPDQYGIYTCLICGKLMKRKALATFTLRHASSHNWMQLYSVRGSKWTEEHLDCK